MRTVGLSLLVGALLSGCGGAASGSDGGCFDTTKSPADLISNPGFECGGATPADWSAVYGTLSFPSAGRTGRAAQVTVDTSGGRFAYNPLLTGGGTSTYCFTAWVKGTAPYMRMRVLRDSGGNYTAFDFSAPVTGEWTRVPPTTAQAVPFMQATSLTLLFEAQVGRSDGMNAKPGDTLLVDDVDAWVSSSGRCDEQR